MKVISLISLTVLCLVVSILGRQSFVKMMDDKIKSTFNVIEATSHGAIANFDLTELEKIAQANLTDPDIREVQFFDANDKLIASAGEVKDPTNTTLKTQEIKGPTGKKVGAMKITYSTDRVNGLFWVAAIICVLCAFLFQVGLSTFMTVTFDHAINPLNHSLASLSRVSNVLTDVSTELKQTGDKATSSSEDLAGNVRRTAEAMTEMTQMLSKTSDLAEKSEEIVKFVSEKAGLGKEVMTKLSSAMSNIQQVNERVQNINNIISQIREHVAFIHDIAFQSQILSFNASIEAARSGEHGRGFAVIASQINRLASESSLAAKTISDFLETSKLEVGKITNDTETSVREGYAVTVEALQRFTEIFEEIDGVAKQVNLIREVSREQKIGIDQTTEALTEVSKITDFQKNISEQSSTISRTLSKEVQVLLAVLGDTDKLIFGTEKKNFLEKPDKTTLKAS